MCAMYNVAEHCKEKMSPEYQDWVNEVQHCYDDTIAEFWEEYRRTDSWPEPYRTLSFHAVRQSLNLQAENARFQMSSLFECHFESGTGKLTLMGRNRLQNIIDQGDLLGQVVYVHRSPVTAETAARISDVKKELTALGQDASTFEIVEAKSTPSSVSGAEAAAAAKLLTSPPKLGGSTSGTGTSGGSGGSSSSSGATP
jgi:hypothetical protein